VLLDVSPAVTTVYSLISVSDGTVPVCGTQLSQSATVTIQQSVTAGIANEPVELCAGTSLPLQLINFLTGADPGGQWAETSAQPSLPGAFNAQTGTFETAGQPAGTYTFKYTLTAVPPCTGDEETVTVKLLELPLADAGEDQAINCDQAAGRLGGANTSTGPGMFYKWLANCD